MTLAQVYGKILFIYIKFNWDMHLTDVTTICRIYGYGKLPQNTPCRDYIFQLSWPDGFRCPNCSHEKAWQIEKILFQSAMGLQRILGFGSYPEFPTANVQKIKRLI